MAAAKPTPEQLIDLIVKRAPQLIAAGVTSLTIDGFSCTLAPPPPAPDALEKPKPLPPVHPDPLRDASTYPGGVIPGFTLDDEDTFQRGRRT